MQTNQSPPTPSHRWSSPDDAVTVLWHYRAAARREYGAHAILTNHGTMPATYDNQQRALFNTTPTASHYDHYIEPSPRGRRRPYQAHSSGASQVRQASSPLRLESYGYPSGSPAYDTSSLTPAIYGGHHAEASATYRSSESFVGLQDGWMADVPVTSDIAHTNSTTYLNRSPSDFANVPFPDGSFALAQDPFPTPGTFRLSTPARATGSPEARHYPQARNEVGTSRQREAAQRRRRAPARMFCDYPGCHASFTRGHNYRHHIQGHENRRSFTCAICAATFNNRSALTGHSRRMHHGAMTNA